MGGISGSGLSNHCLSDQSVDVASAEVQKIFSPLQISAIFCSFLHAKVSDHQMHFN